MPNFFFDIECETITLDRIRADLPDEGTAKEYARGLAATILGHPQGDADAKPWSVRITDQDGQHASLITSADYQVNDNYRL